VNRFVYERHQELEADSNHQFIYKRLPKRQLQILHTIAHAGGETKVKEAEKKRKVIESSSHPSAV
jgi:hypothetical protein